MPFFLLIKNSHRCIIDKSSLNSHAILIVWGPYMHALMKYISRHLSRSMCRDPLEMGHIRYVTLRWVDGLLMWEASDSMERSSSSNLIPSTNPTQSMFIQVKVDLVITCFGGSERSYWHEGYWPSYRLRSCWFFLAGQVLSYRFTKTSCRFQR